MFSEILTGKFVAHPLAGAEVPCAVVECARVRTNATHDASNRFARAR